MIYKTIPTYEGKYSISEKGDVVSHPKNYGFGLHEERNLKQTNQNGYKSIRLGRGKKNFHYIHQLVALTFLEHIPGKNFVNHKDGNKKNNHFSNLEWCTNAENVRHMFKSGLSKNRYLSVEDVLKIRSLRNKKFTYIQIAKIFSISRGHASEAARGIGRFSDTIFSLSWTENLSHDDTRDAIQTETFFDFA
jgi:hypothetical protein